MIDRVLSIDKSKIVAIKNTSANEEFFKGHFAGFPIMPGALMVEGMGQAFVPAFYRCSPIEEECNREKKYSYRGRQEE